MKMRRNISGRLVSVLITLAWLIAVGMLINKYYGHGVTGASGPDHQIPTSFFEEQWMGVYMNGEKIGYSFSKLEPLNGGYKLTEKLKMKLIVMGTEKDVETVINAVLDDNLLLDSFETSVVSDFTIHVNGRVEGKRLFITMDTGGTEQSQALDLERAPSFDAVLLKNLVKNGLGEGRKTSMPVIDPASMSIEEMTMEVAGREPVMSMGSMRDAYKLKGTIKGIELTVWVTEDGTVLREESPLGLTLVKEEKEDAVRLEKPSLDMVAETSVPFNLTLPPDTRYLKVRISGIDPKGLALHGGRQRLEGDVLEIRRESPGSTPPPDKDISDEFLRETMTIQAKDPAIVSRAEKITEDADTPLKKAKAIHDWVYGNIAKSPVISIPSAVEVLRERRGDCNEHTILYTALARASGIPTRIAVGLAYKDGSFYYHAWPEVLISGWVAVDPTFGQFPADAAHVRLITGDLEEQTSLLPIIGNIRIEGIEYR
jgi:hypothetical protein